MESKKASKKRHGKAYYAGSVKKKKMHNEHKYGPGYSGFLITYDCKKEKFAVQEAYSLLNEYADQLYGPEELPGREQIDDNSEEEYKEESNVEAELEREISSMKELAHQERRFKALDTKAKHNIFIRAKVDNVNKLAEIIFNDLLEKGIKKTRYCMRFLPVKQTCYASVEKISQHSKIILEELVQENNGQPCTIHIQFRERFNNSLKKVDVVASLISVIKETGEDNIPVLKDGDYTLDVNVLKNTCAISLLKDYNKFKKYNLQSLGNEASSTNEQGKHKVETSEEIENGTHSLDKRQTEDTEEGPKETLSVIADNTCDKTDQANVDQPVDGEGDNVT